MDRRKLVLHQRNSVRIVKGSWNTDGDTTKITVTVSRMINGFSQSIEKPVTGTVRTGRNFIFGPCDQISSGFFRHRRLDERASDIKNQYIRHSKPPSQSAASKTISIVTYGVQNQYLKSSFSVVSCAYLSESCTHPSHGEGPSATEIRLVQETCSPGPSSSRKNTSGQMAQGEAQQYTL